MFDQVLPSGRGCLRALAAVVVLMGGMMSGCSGVFYQPDRNLYFPPDKLGYHAQEVHFTSGDGTRLFGWFFPAQGARGSAVKGTVLQFHGNAENISSHYTALVWLTKRGYNLFTFDYRGYGRSEGEPDQEGVYKDGMAALDKAWELRKGRRFVVVGQSLGGAVALRAFADFRHQSQTTLVVMDSTFTSYKRVARRVMASHWFTWPLSPLAMLLVSDKYGATEANRRNKTRLLVIHDRQDPAVPFANGEELYQDATCEKDFWVLDDGRHIEAFAPYNTQYREKFVELLEKL